MLRVQRIRQLEVDDARKAGEIVAEARSAAREAGEKADALASELDAARERMAELEEMVAERDRQILQRCEILLNFAPPHSAAAAPSEPPLYGLEFARKQFSKSLIECAVNQLSR